ncbi:MAG: hypothetical protein ACYCQK_02120 [Acidiferrobacteraceae bacterium]
MKHRTSPATVIAFVALFFSLGGASLAASRYLITSVRQIQPSVRHALRGPRGPRGPQGATGAQGAAGPQGPAGAAGQAAPFLGFTTAEGPVVTVPAGADSTATGVHCPNLETATGGGYITQDSFSSASLVVTNDEPSMDETGRATGWLITASNPTSGPLNLRAWVACAT